MIAALALPRLGLSLAAGSLTTLSPCVFPVLPLVLGGAVQRNRLAPLAMGLGMIASFTGVGVLLGALGPILGLDSIAVRQAGAVLMIAFAIVMVVPRLADRFARGLAPVATAANAATTRLDGGSLGGALALGAALGLVWSPCSGPLLGSALTLVATHGGALEGGVALAVFGLGAALPLVGAAYASRSAFRRASGWVLAHAEQVRRGFGVVLLLVGVGILGGADHWLESQVLQALPQAWVNATVSL